MSLLNYFDLNRRMGSALAAQAEETSVPSDFGSTEVPPEPPIPEATVCVPPPAPSPMAPVPAPPADEGSPPYLEIEATGKRRMSALEQTVMYAGIVIGVLFSNSVQQFRVGQALSFQSAWPVVGMSAVIGLMLMPLVFEKLKVDSDSPFVVRLGLFVQNGVFWQVLIEAIGRSAGG